MPEAAGTVVTLFGAQHERVRGRALGVQGRGGDILHVLIVGARGKVHAGDAHRRREGTTDRAVTVAESDSPGAALAHQGCRPRDSARRGCARHRS